MRSTRLRPLLLLFALLLVLPSGTAAQPEASTVRVLLVGNSFVYYNNMPAILEALAASTDGAAIDAEMIVEAGASLKDHWEAGGAAARIREGNWDYVVLGAQSTFGRVFLIEGEYRVGGAGSFLEYGRRFAEAAREAGARVVLLSHWKHPRSPVVDQEMIDYAHGRLARETEALVAPVGPAFQAVLRESPAVTLYAQPGDHHPSPAGSYLAAAVLHATILRRSPEGGPGSVRGIAIEPDDGTPTGAAVDLVDLPDAVATSIQRAAWEIHEGMSDFARVAGSRPPAISLPVVPRGRPAVTSDLAGHWSGSLRLYPWPGTLSLDISTKDDEISLRADVSFGGTPDDIRIEPRDVAFDGRRLRFVDPDGPNGSLVEYVGVLVGERLVGVAEMSTDNGGVYGRGSWELVR